MAAGLDGLFQGLQDDALKLNGFGSERLSVAQTYHRLRNIQRRTQAGNTGGDFSDRHLRSSD
jgi:hypothetical protein